MEKSRLQVNIMQYTQLCNGKSNRESLWLLK